MLSKWVGGGGGAYYNAVWQAVLESKAYANFRRHPDYNTILEHVTKEEGERYLSMLSERDIRDVCFASVEADTVGNPVVFEFDGVFLSPTTLRYGKVAQDFLNFFPRFDSFETIAEIGVGYGGQIRLIADLCRMRRSRLRTATLIDMLPVVLLAQSYLDNFDMYCRCVFNTKSQLDRDGHWDFLYSNYAFAEFDRSLQDEYMNNVIKRSANGYLTMNTGIPGKTEWNPGSYTIHELLDVLPNAVIVRDEPETLRSNYIVVFGDHSLGGGVAVERYLAELG